MKKMLAVIMVSMFICVGCAHKPKPVETAEAVQTVEPSQPQTEWQRIYQKQSAINAEYEKKKAEEQAKKDSEKEQPGTAKKVFRYIIEATAIGVIGHSLGLDGAIGDAVIGK